MTRQLKTLIVAALGFSLFLNSIIYACSGRDFMDESSGHPAHASIDRGTVKTNPCAQNKADVCASVRISLLSIQALQTAWNHLAHLFVAYPLVSAETLSAYFLLLASLKPIYRTSSKVSLFVFHLALRI